MSIVWLVGFGMLMVTIGGLIWFGRSDGTNATRAGDAAQDEATQASVITKQQQMAQAEADAPHDTPGVMHRANDGTF
nr:hypothetical protein [uncultured Lichenicoccus sp.]